ncbi:aldo/keto reductase [Nocardia crassostreae]|uniref:aldo/keto reductase n=1 Tax=Nocardia crassostreae TaxID=53428 RepID=UPI000B02F6C0|nr:aldo/keto reductase [Nocardia crassostreae]
MVNMALEKGRLHDVVRDSALPEFAGEWGCRSWTEFFLKYVVAHPAVTCVVPATTQVAHVVENLTAARGALPDESQRQRMVQHMESFPAFAKIAQTAWYPGKRFTDGLVRLPDPAPVG